MHLAPVTPDNFDAAVALSVRDDQHDLVRPVVRSLAEAYVHPAMAWPRLIHDGDDLVGFLMAYIDAPYSRGGTRSGLWRLNIAASRQGRGYGRWAVEAVCAELRSRGTRQAYVSWHPREGGPQPFYLKLGFRPTGEMLGDQVVGVRDI
jgi:diamine N-acetyltransferase